MRDAGLLSGFFLDSLSFEVWLDAVILIKLISDANILSQFVHFFEYVSSQNFELKLELQDSLDSIPLAGGRLDLLRKALKQVVFGFE